MRRVKVLVCVCVIFFLVMSLGIFLSADNQQSAKELYEAAVFKKDADGDMPGAIKIFREIVARFPDNKEMAAKSQLQIGLCYEKLGNESIKEAQDAFQKVVDNYPLQSEEVRAAREKLSFLLKVKSTDAKNENEFKIEVVWPKPKWGIEGSLSPDGRYLSFVDWDTSDLAYRDLVSGKTYRLTDRASHPERQESAYDSFWSPDSKQIAYCWENDTEKYYDIRVMTLASKAHKTLYRVGYFDAFIQPCGWTPDGKHILIGIIEKKFKMGLLSVADGSLRIIKELDFLARRNFPGFIQFSPDGEHIAYDFQQNGDTPSHDIYILSSDGTKNAPLVSHPAHDYFLGWAPDGKRIFFASDRTGAVDLWIVSVEEGKQNGDPLLLRRNIGSIKPLGITQDGSFFFNTAKGEVPSDIHNATLDSVTGEVLSPPKKLALPYQGNNLSPTWSPDGEHIAYISRRGVTNQRILCIYSVETGRIRTILYKNEVSHPRWAPDGRSILVGISGEGISKVNVQTEEFISVARRKIEQEKEIPIASPNISPDNNSIFYAWFDRDNTVTHVMARDLKTEKEKELYSIALYEHNMVLSPDGQNLALMCSENPYENKMKKHVLKIIPVAGGEVRDITSFEQVGSWGLVDIGWSPDGQNVFFSKLSSEQKGDKPQDWELWKVSVMSGPAEKTGLKIRGIPYISIHPDGQQIVWSSYSAGTAPVPEVWVMENFLPKINNKK
ncbi:MAG: tetratricopeptide repeat protein [Candidatus Aminicenantes bacterium]|nr:tetratricopeptide repeat protein [Candidatus Aminicenantes bacterium]